MEDEILKLNSTSFIELNFVKDEKVKISPIGDVTGRDGRVFNIEGQKIINNMRKNKIDIALNENHFSSKAFGWFDLNSLELRDDGIYASLSLNNLGQEVIDNKHYRYLSPEYMCDIHRNIVNIIGVALVNQPNLLTKALNNIEKNKNLLKEEKKMDKEDKENGEQLKKEVNNLKNVIEQKDELIKTLTKTLKETKVNNAIANNILLPANKEFALNLEVNQVDSYLATLKKDEKDLHKELNVFKDKESENLNNEVFKQLGLEK